VEIVQNGNIHFQSFLFAVETAVINYFGIEMDIVADVGVGTVVVT
jgi:hypothetical protein